MGEVNGLPPLGFEFGNSPSELVGVDLAGKTIIQRTSRGTLGVVRSDSARHLMTASFPCAAATARYIKQHSPASVTFINTGIGPDGLGDEDAACAEYIEALLANTAPDPEIFLERVRNCAISRRVFADPEKTRVPWKDIEYCTDLDRFDFAMPVTRKGNYSVMRAASV